MGNCQQSYQNENVTNFNDGSWLISETTIHPYCFALQNCCNPHLRMFKWISTSNKKNKIMFKLRQQSKLDFLPKVFQEQEKEKLPLFCTESKERDIDIDAQKKSYILTEELIRLRDTDLSFEEAVTVLFQSLQAYQELRKELGGFVALQDMIFVNRCGTVKVWMNANLANEQPQFPHPTISQEQFISSLLNQIFTNIRLSSNDSLTHNMYDYFRSGNITFNQILLKLKSFISKNNLLPSVTIDKLAFQKVVKKDQKYQKFMKIYKENSTQEKDDQKSQKCLKFIVAEGEQQNNCGFVKDYSKKSTYDGDQRHRFTESVSSHKTLKRSLMSSSAPSTFFHPRYILINQSFSP